MAYGSNTTYVRYTLVRGSGRWSSELRPLVTYRDFHSLSRGTAGRRVCAGARWDRSSCLRRRTPFRILCSDGTFTPEATWYFNFLHREERARGLDDTSDLFVPGTSASTPARGSP